MNTKQNKTKQEQGLELASATFNKPVNSNAELQEIGKQLLAEQNNRWFIDLVNVVGLTEISQGLRVDENWLSELTYMVDLQGKGSTLKRIANINNREPFDTPNGEDNDNIAILELGAVKDNQVVEYIEMVNTKTFKITISRQQIASAFETGEAFGSFVAEQMSALSTNMNYWYKNNLLPSAVQAIGLSVDIGTKPTDELSYKLYNENINTLVNKFELERDDTNECSLPRLMTLSKAQGILILSADIKRKYENTIRPYKNNNVETYFEAGTIKYLEDEEISKLFGGDTSVAGVYISPKKMVRALHLKDNTTTPVNSGLYTNHFLHMWMTAGTWDMEVGVVLRYSATPLSFNVDGFSVGKNKKAKKLSNHKTIIKGEKPKKNKK